MTLTNAMAELSEQRQSSTVNSKIHSDSGYGSNKSNSQSQRSSGSSKSQLSSLSSGSGSGYPPHPNAPVSKYVDCQPHAQPSPAGGTGSANSGKRQGKKKNKLDRKLSAGEKNETRLSHEDHVKNEKKVGGGGGGCASGPGSQHQPMDLSGQSIRLRSTPSSSKASSTHDSKALQVAALTHALSCMKKFQDPIPESEINDDSEECWHRAERNWQEYIPEDYKDATEDAFATVVSLDDGVVVYLTPSISNILGFPKDMLVGRSFIDFVHPKDRMAFASHITCGINFPIGDPNPSMQSHQGPTVKSEPFYCRLRQYRGLKTVGFGVTDKTVVYHTFKLTMQLKKVDEAAAAVGEISELFKSSSGVITKDSESFTGNTSINSDTFGELASSQVQNAVYLVIGANKLKSAYQYSEEIPKNPVKFVTRHSANCHYGHMDAEAISYLGHLPQDLVGNSVLDYYHPEDMNLMKDIYEAVMQEQGKPFRSKPYRFRVFNGTFAMLETDWSCFVNPWSRKLEFVIGQHSVVQGPVNPNVFMSPNPKEDETLLLSDEVKSNGNQMQNEIQRMLTETVTKKISDPLRQQSSRRRKDLAALMETLLEKMAKTENSDKCGSQCSGFSVMERNSAMLGEISPQTVDNSGSNLLHSSECSSSTPPSYNQLNYRENIERFFQSQPKTERSDESVESVNKNDAQNQSSEPESPNIDYSSGSNIRTSNGSNESGNDQIGDGGSGGEGSQFDSRGSLTQELLTQHNEDMEKFMIQRHRNSRTKASTAPGSHKESRHRNSETFLRYVFPLNSSRSVDDSSDLIKYSKMHTKSKKNLHKCDAVHGIKRTGNFSQDGDSHAKQPHLDTKSVTASNSNTVDNSNCAGDTGTGNSINLWPPFSISVTPGVTTPSYRYSYPSYLFANPSSAGCGGPPSIPGSGSTGLRMEQPLHRTTEPLISSTHRSNCSSLFDNMGKSTSPFVVVPGQQQFLSQQVQLMPAGMIYQPIYQPYGQHPPILMPLGTMVHPGPSIFLGGSTSSVAAAGLEIPSSSLPLLSRSSTTKTSVSVAGCTLPTSSEPKVSLADTTFMKTSTNFKSSFSKTYNSVPVTTSTVSASGNFWKHDRAASFPLSPPKKIEHKKLNVQVDSSIDGTFSGSDEGMTISSVYTKDFKDEMDQDQFISYQSMNSENSDEKPEQRLKILRNKEPPWLENLTMSSEISFRYTVPMRNLSDILQKDLQALKIIGQQSPQVNDQLSMLYKDLEQDGMPDSALYVDEGFPCSSGEEQVLGKDATSSVTTKKAMNMQQYSRVAIVYEENSPFPPDNLCAKSPVESQAL